MRQWQPWPATGGLPPCTPAPLCQQSDCCRAARLPLPQRRTLGDAQSVHRGGGRVCCHMLSACACTLQAQRRLPSTPPRCGGRSPTYAGPAAVPLAWVYAVAGKAWRATGLWCGPRTVLNGTTQPRCVHTAARGAPPLHQREQHRGALARCAGTVTRARSIDSRWLWGLRRSIKTDHTGTQADSELQTPRQTPCPGHKCAPLRRARGQVICPPQRRDHKICPPPSEPHPLHVVPPSSRRRAPPSSPLDTRARGHGSAPLMP